MDGVEGRIIATSGSREKLDTLVTIYLRLEGEPVGSKALKMGNKPEILFLSPVRTLFCKKQDEVLHPLLEEYSACESLKRMYIIIEDNHGFDFVLRGRLRAALSKAVEEERKL
ncbi:MAG: hypothetical protein JEY99_08355 [Spirochaetales bacterium]|nr:hypothetical protein [Spirochaetales bacterium]